VTSPLFHLTLPDASENEPAHFAPLLIVLEAMIQLNEWHIARSLRMAQKGMGDPIAPLYVSGVSCRDDDITREDWCDVFATIKRGRVNNGSLVAWRVAELRVAGIAAEPVLKWRLAPRDEMIRRGYSPRTLSRAKYAWIIHCAVKHPDGRIEDVTEVLRTPGNDGWSLVTKPLFHLTLPDPDKNEPAHFAPLLIVLEGMVKLDEWHIARSLRRAQKGEGEPLPPLYVSGVRYKEDDAGHEDWRDVYKILERGAGDCVPLSTRVIRREDMRSVAIADLRVGDHVADGINSWAEVKAHVQTGTKALLEFTLDNGKTVRCSPEHKLFFASDVQMRKHGVIVDLEERAKDVIVGQRLLTAEARHGATVLAIRSAGSAECADIETSSGRFWLPESDVIVHNCDNLAAWRTAELRVAGIAAEPVIKWQWVPREVMIGHGYPSAMLPGDGVWLVHCEVRHPDGRIEDPSKILGMGGEYMERV